MTREVRVHMDTLEYSRRGLATRDSISLDVGTHTRVILVRPDRVRPVRSSGVGFAHGSAFPLPGTLLTLWGAKDVDAPFSYHRVQEDAWARPVIQVYGHCATEEVDAAKQLSERRARVVTALICSDAEAFAQLAEEDAWGDAEAQSMLRMLGCDPGPVDGKAERLTLEAARVFAGRYDDGTFHDERRPPAEEIGSVEALDDVRTELMEAFVLSHGLGFAADRLHPHNPSHGCCGFNQALNGSVANRRASVVSHATVPEHSENAPCRTGDAQACAVVDDRDMSCMWYREHVSDPTPGSPSLFDPRWLWIGDDRYVLSSLTTADDGESVEFEVFDADGDATVTERLEGVVRGGVAAVVWASNQTPDATDGHPPHQQQPRFSVRHPNHPDALAHANWPERRAVELIHISSDHEALRARSGGIRLIADDGSYDHFTRFTEAVTRSLRHVVLVFPDVPSNARVDAVLESGPLRWPVLRAATVEVTDGSCAAGEQCEELPASPGAPTYQLEADDEDWTASVGVEEGEEVYERNDGENVP